MMLPVERLIDELDAFEAHGAPVLTVYLNVNGNCSSQRMLDELQRLVAPLAADLPMADRRDLEVELDVLRDYLSSMVCPPAAVALFTCTRRHFFRVQRLATAVTASACWAARPQLAALRAAAHRADEGAAAETAQRTGSELAAAT